MLWRIHGDRFGATQLNPIARPRPCVGGRFDSLDGQHSYLYVGDTPATAVAESLCRDLPADQSPRLIQRAQIADRRLSEVRTDRDIHVADLTGTAPINGTVRHAKSAPSTYLATRRWAAAILAANPTADGLQYRPPHNENTLAWMLTGPPSGGDHPALTGAGVSIDLDSLDGRLLLGPLLAAHNAALTD